MFFLLRGHNWLLHWLCYMSHRTWLCIHYALSLILGIQPESQFVPIMEINLNASPAQRPSSQRTAQQEESDYCRHLGRCFCWFRHNPCPQTHVCPRCRSLCSCPNPAPSSARFLCPPVLRAPVMLSISSCLQTGGIHSWCERVSPEDRLLYCDHWLLNCSLLLSVSLDFSYISSL